MGDLPDINTPLPDLAHESLRQSVVAALGRIDDHVQALADAFLVGQTAADGLTIALTNFLALQGALTQQAQQITDLEARVASLENPPPPPSAPAPIAPFSY